MHRFLLSMCFILSIGNAHAQETDDEAYQAKLKMLQSTIVELKSELENVKDSKDKLQTNLQSSEVDISKLIKKVERLKGDLASQKKHLAQLKTQRSELQQSRTQQQHIIVQHINAAHRLGQQSQIKLLLNQQNPAEIARTLKYYQYFLDARSEKIDDYIDTITEIDRIEPEIKQQTTRLEKNKHSLEKQHQALSQRQGERRNVLAKLKLRITSTDKELKKLNQDKQQLETLIKQLAEAIINLNLSGDGQPFANRRGKMTLPVKGKLKHTYGSQRIAGKLTWDGIVITAQEGTPVTAVHHGRVIFSDYMRSHGLLLIIDHGDGYMSLYANNQTLSKDLGDWVGSGDVIARLGSTGGQSYPGLYFEIRHQGQPVNPRHWFSK